MNKKIIKWLVLALWALFPGFARASNPQNLTLNQALEIAQRQNPSLKAQEAQVNENFFAYKAAGSLPSLSLAGNYSGGSNNIVTNNGQTQDLNINLSQSFGPLGSVQLSGKAAFQAYEISKANYDETRIAVKQNVKDAFYSLLAAQEEIQVSRENLDLADKLYHLAKKRFDAGASPETDEINAGIQRAAAEQAVIQAEAALKQARTAFNTLLAFPPTQPVEVSGDLKLIPLDKELPALLQTATENRPLLKAAKESVEEAQTQVSFAQSQGNPAPSLFYTHDVTTPSLYLFGVSVQFPLFDYGQIKNQVKVQENVVVERKNELTGTLLNVSSSVKNSFDAYKAAYQNALTYQEKVLLPSEKLMKMTQFGYAQGGLPYLQVLVAEQNLRNARLQFISLLLSGHQSMDALEASVGTFSQGEKP